MTWPICARLASPCMPAASPLLPPPGTIVSRAQAIPVVCDGVTVNAGDIVAADSDGVVVVPREIAPKILVLAQQLDFKEHSMYAYIENTKSIEEAVKKFGRL